MPDRPLHWSAEETTDLYVADQRNFYKVEQWTADDLHIERMVYAGNSLDRARAVFDAEVGRRPGGRFTIRQRIRVIEQWPPTSAEKTVFVNEYLRCRNGKWEVVASHFRKPRRKKRG